MKKLRPKIVELNPKLKQSARELKPKLKLNVNKSKLRRKLNVKESNTSRSNRDCLLLKKRKGSQLRSRSSKSSLSTTNSGLRRQTPRGQSILTPSRPTTCRTYI